MIGGLGLQRAGQWGQPDTQLSTLFDEQPAVETVKRSGSEKFIQSEKLMGEG